MQQLNRCAKNLLITVMCLIASVAYGVDIENPIRHLIQTSNIGQTQYSITIKDIDYDVMLAEINSDKQMIPASNMKLLTTSAALYTLGSDFVFNTELRLIPDKDLPSLIIKGDGDPAFCDPILLRDHDLSVDDVIEQWVNAIKETGKKKFHRLYIDDRVFDRVLTHPSWERNDLLKSYGAQISGLNFYLNCIDITPVPSSYIGQTPSIIMYPDSPSILPNNRAKTGKSDTFSISRRLGTNELSFFGNIKNRTGPYKITVHDPSIFFSQYLISELNKVGVEVMEIVPPDFDATLPKSELLHVVRTTLPLVLARTNQNSVNMYAESLFKRMGNRVTGSPGSWNNGAAAMRIYLRRIIGPSASAIQISDGSGLSRDNHVSSRLIVQLLESVYRDPDNSTIFRESLAYAGRTENNKRMTAGTLHRRFKSLKPNHWVFGKTGSLTGVRTVSGYYMYPSPNDPTITRTIAFSLLFNNIKAPVQEYQIKNLQDKIIAHVQNALLLNEQVNSH